MKKIIIYTSIFLLSMLAGVFAVVSATESGTTSKYTKEIDACMKARDTEHGGAGAKSIEEYICPVGTLSSQEIAFQVIMSIEFKKLDNQVKKDLKKIHEGSNKDTGALASNIRDLFESKDSKAYPERYAEICNSSTKDEAALYFKGKGTSLTTDNNAVGFVFGQKTGNTKYLSCQELVDMKLKAYKASAWLLGEGAVVKSFKNDKHEYMRKLKDQYEKFLNKWTTYIGQLGVIKDKWPTKTK